MIMASINEPRKLSLNELLTMHAPREAVSTIPSLILTTAKLGCGLNESMDFTELCCLNSPTSSCATPRLK